MADRTEAPGGSARRMRQAAMSVIQVLMLTLAPLTAAAAAGPSDADCLMCHKNSSLARDMGRSGSLTVDAAALAHTGHGKLACIECHKGTTLRHPTQLPAVDCVGCHKGTADSLSVGAHRRVGGKGASVDAACRACHGGVHKVAAKGRALCERCHEKASKDYATSVHGLARLHGDADASTCRDCHGHPHGVRSKDDPESMTGPFRITETCAKCHADRQLMAKRKITIPEAVQLFRNSAHGRSKKEGAARCNDCHESHDLKRANDPTSSIYRGNIPATCGKCHRKEAARYAKGVHGQALVRGVTATPVCTDCHGEHMIRGPHANGSPVAAANVSETCSRCHEATGIRETFGLPAGRLSSYRDSFHGLAARGGSPVVANCASCHGYHDILPSTDPASLVSPQRVGETCGKCHPGAGTKFKISAVHVTMATESQPVPYWTRIVYLFLIAGTIGFMALHQGLDFVRKIGASFSAHLGQAPSHGHAATRWFERMTVAERIQHFLLAVSFFTLVYTGFALKFPENILFHWMTQLEGGYSWRALVHRIAAVAMVAVSLFHVAYLFTPRGRKLVMDLFPQPKDALDLVQQMLYLVGLRRTPARFDRFGYIEKAEYWALIWGTVVMTLTGFILWFENSSLRELPKWMIDLSTVVHYYEAWLAFLAIVVWHLYMNIVNPDVYPMNWTWLTGRISDAQMRHEHIIEYERILEAELKAELKAEAKDETAPAEPGAREGGPGVHE
ncbi:MAG: cytochrome c3 family protein [Candidatus Eisenbacteria bacterium]|nr:cytochrome c3 family protein [Candidatus Eisenbacteria bacterium]